MSVRSKKQKESWKKDLVHTLHVARETASEMSTWSSQRKNKILQDVAREIEKKASWIARENKKDLKRAKKEGLSSAMMDRLTLNKERIQVMADGVRTVAHQPDPIGAVLRQWRRPNGLRIKKVSVPLGLILIIYESRPNVTVECASLCIKSSNAVLLRGGKEAFYSNHALVKIFETVLKKHKLSTSSVNLVKTTDRKAVDFLLKRDRDINLVIPRGGQGLIRTVVRKSHIPVVKHFQGICHVYVDKKADLKKAVSIAINAKLHRPGVCNAMETLLVHRDIAARFLPRVGSELQKGGCEVRGDQTVKQYLSWAKKAKSKDYGFEFLDKILAIRTVKNLDEAMEHIRTHGSGHTDAIVTEDKKSAETFKKCVDSSSVMVNASTRFADGFEYGFGAEIGISTDKIHARGPMGLEGLTSYKYVVEGCGQIRN